MYNLYLSPFNGLVGYIYLAMSFITFISIYKIQKDVPAIARYKNDLYSENFNRFWKDVAGTLFIRWTGFHNILVALILVSIANGYLPLGSTWYSLLVVSQAMVMFVTIATSFILSMELRRLRDLD